MAHPNGDGSPRPYWIDFSSLYRKADAIAHAHASKNLIFFLGSGASKAYAAEVPGWSELLDELLSKLTPATSAQRDEILSLITNRDYLLAAKAIKQYSNTNLVDRDVAVNLAVGEILRHRIKISRPDPLLHLSILDFSVPIVTTNFDTIVESLISKYEVQTYSGTAITYDDESDVALLLDPTRKCSNYVFKLHGSIEKTKRLILDETDYSDFYFKSLWPTSRQFLRHVLSTKMAIFVGFSLADPEILLILREATQYSSSYQHIALMVNGSLSPIQTEVLRSDYRVDPILYSEHSHLPHFVMEMRNFTHREGLPLHLLGEREKLKESIREMRIHLLGHVDAPAIVLGSFAKYGRLANPNADVDLLLLPPHPSTATKLQSPSAEKILGRKIDATVLPFGEFERLLRCGDPFASSVLVTGCPVEDPDGRYGILARGFREHYDREDVLKNAKDRCRVRWLRLCLYIDDPLQTYLPACYQWTITLMQFFILQNDYPIDSLLTMSLLGNSRYTIREFAARFNNVDEGFFLALMRSVKEPSQSTEAKRPTVNQLVSALVLSLQSRSRKLDLDVVRPGDFCMYADVHEIADLYQKIAGLLTILARGEKRVGVGYGGPIDVEQQFISCLKDKQITPFDYLFLFGLDSLLRTSNGPLSNEDVLVRCRHAQIQWQQSPGATFLDQS